MTQINFSKYQGTGNDFIMINQLNGRFFDGSETAVIQRLCDRRFGIGADGFILLNSKDGYDFEMDYFNADGHRGSMCGNGARCTIAFARSLGIKQAEYSFFAPDGPHKARRHAKRSDWIEIEMATVHEIENGGDYFFMDTGSPHYIQFVDTLDGLDVEQQGKAIRYNTRFKEKGTNVNFVSTHPGQPILVNTYERGVEAETLSCGTGVTAAAIAYTLQQTPSGDADHTVPIQTKGGALEVRLSGDRKGGFKNIWLAGPAEEVFRGQFHL